MSEGKDIISSALRIAQRYQAQMLGYQDISVEIVALGEGKASVNVSHFPCDENGVCIKKDNGFIMMERFNFGSWKDAEELNSELERMTKYLKDLES